MKPKRDTATAVLFVVAVAGLVTLDVSVIVSAPLLFTGACAGVAGVAFFGLSVRYQQRARRARAARDGGVTLLVNQSPLPWPPADPLAALDAAIVTVLADLPHRGYQGSDPVESYLEFFDDGWTPAEIDDEWVGRGLIDRATADAYHAVLAAGGIAVTSRIAR